MSNTDTTHTHAKIEVELRPAKFAKLNKQNTLDEYIEECARPDGSYVENCAVLETIVLTDEGYDQFVNSFMEDNPLIAGKGGTGSTADLPDVDSFMEYTEEQRQEFRCHAYGCVISIKAPNRTEVFVNPQGHDYCRYVGLPLAPEGVDGLTDPQRKRLNELHALLREQHDAHGCRVSLREAEVWAVNARIKAKVEKDGGAWMTWADGTKTYSAVEEGY